MAHTHRVSPNAVFTVLVLVAMLGVAYTLAVTGEKKRKRGADLVRERMEARELNATRKGNVLNNCICQMGDTLPQFKNQKPGSWCRAQRTKLSIESYFLLPKDDPDEAEEWMVLLCVPDGQRDIELNGGGRSQTSKDRQMVLKADTHRAVSAVHFKEVDIDYSGDVPVLHTRTKDGDGRGSGRMRGQRAQPARPVRTRGEIEATLPTCKRDPAEIMKDVLLQRRRASFGVPNPISTDTPARASRSAAQDPEATQAALMVRELASRLLAP